MTEPDAAELLVVMITAWPDGWRFHDERQQAAMRKLYMRCMLDLDRAAGHAAVMRLIATWKPTSAQRWPSIAELRSAIATVQHGRTPAPGEAWGALHKLRGWHEVEELERLDPALRACIEHLGWLKWETFLRASGDVKRWRVMTGDESEASDRARFLELYEQLAGRDASDRVVGQLAPPVPVRQLTGRTTDDTPAPLADILAGMLPDKGKE